MNTRKVRRPLCAAISLGVLVGLGGLYGCERQAQTPRRALGPLKKLTVLTPHSETICRAFSAGFVSWYAENRGSKVHIAWIRRGTPQCVEYVLSIPAMRNQGADYENPEVMFGGGIADHNKLAEGGFCRSVDLGEAVARIPAEVHGLPTREAEGRWCATGLSSFGILYNERACEQRGIAAPTTWEDLADARFYGWVGLADPVASGSNRECMVLLLQQKGWEEGWGTIVRVLGNARALGARSGEVLGQVGSGVFLAAFAVNFDGMAMAAESGGTLKYFDPPEGTAVTPDITSILTTVKDEELAKDFVRYVLSEEGQALWGVAREHRKTSGETLYHYPIDPAVYEKYGDKLSVAANPLEADFGVQVDLEQGRWYGALINHLVRAACGENHVQLQKAWEAVIAAGMPAEALAELTAPPFDAQTALELGEKLQWAEPLEVEQMTKDWSAGFAERYAKVLGMVEG